MRVHRVAIVNGYSAYLDVSGYGPEVKARVRVVRDADGVSVLTPPFDLKARDSVVQWGYESSHAIIADCLPNSGKYGHHA